MLYSGDCAHFKCYAKIIETLQAFSRPARVAMSKKIRVFILWIILLLSRHFAMDDLKVLSELSTMPSDLCAKRSSITHAEVP